MTYQYPSNETLCLVRLHVEAEEQPSSEVQKRVLHEVVLGRQVAQRLFHPGLRCFMFQPQLLSDHVLINCKGVIFRLIHPLC